MKKYLFPIGAWMLLLLSACSHPKKDGQKNPIQKNNDSVLTVVNWNIEWFGSMKNGPTDKDLQEANVIKVLKYLHADLYGLCEVVNLSRFRKVVKSLGSNYDFVISDYASGANSTHAPYYTAAQKMAFIYDKNIFTNVSAGGFLMDNSKVGYNFSNGRYPYLLQADVKKNGITKHISFFLIHAKSGSDVSSYSRRESASIELKAALDKNYAQTPMMIFGDFNDELQGSITAGETASPYENFILDNNYISLTLPLQKTDAQSTIDYPTIIDQQIISKALDNIYIAHSASIRTDITSIVPDFRNGKTSDHYPVSSEYLFSNTASTSSSSNLNTNPIPTLKPALDSASKVQSKMFTATIQANGIDISCIENKKDIQFVLYNQQDKKIVSVHKKELSAGEVFHLHTPVLDSGIYDLVVFSDAKKEVLKLVKD